MSYLSQDQIKQLLQSLGTEYEQLSNNKTKLENDCAKLKEFIGAQIQQIKTLNSDFEKLRQEFMRRREEFSSRGLVEKQSQLPIQEAAVAEEEQQAQEENLVEENPEYTGQPATINLLALIQEVSIVTATSYSPDGKYLAVGSQSTLRVFYNTENFDRALDRNNSDTEEQENHIKTIAWTIDSKYIICGYNNSTIRIYKVPVEGEAPPEVADQPDTELAKEFKIDSPVYQIQNSHNGKFFAFATDDGTITVIEVGTWNELWSTKSNDPNVSARSLAISPDDKFIAIGCSDKLVKIFSTEKRCEVGSVEAHESDVFAIKFIPSANRIITGGFDKAIKIWDLIEHGDQVEIKLWKVINCHSNLVLSLAIDPTGEWALSGSKDVSAAIINLKTGEWAYRLKGHQNTVISVDFDPAKNELCTGCGDKYVRIWSIRA